MNPEVRARDPRLRLAMGLAVCLAAGLLLRTAVPTTPSGDLRIHRAIELADAGDAQRAYEVLQSVVVDHPQDAEAWMRTGQALAKLDRPFEAAVYLRKAVELDPASSVAREEFVNGLIQAELYEEAEMALESARGVWPDDPQLVYLAAALAARRAEAHTAAGLFRRAMERGAAPPDRFRTDPLFDPVRNHPAFLQAVYDTRVPRSFDRERAS